MTIQIESSVDSREEASRLRNEASGILTQIGDEANSKAKAKELRAKYNAIIDRIQGLERPYSSFRRLPTELIILIFSKCSLLSSDTLFILCLVCTEWLELVTQSAELWTQVMISLNEPYWEDQLETYYLLSRERLLSITLPFPFPVQDLHKITKESHRWEILTVVEGRTGAEKDPWRFPLRPTDSNVLLRLLKDKPFPNLRDLDVQVKLVNTFSPLLWKNMFSDRTELDSVALRPILLSHLTVNLFFMEFDELVIMLAQLPDLSFLKLSAQRRSRPNLTPDYQGPKVPLKRLAELILEEPGSAAMLLQRISCPTLRELKTIFDLIDYIYLIPELEQLLHLKSLVVTLSHTGEVTQRDRQMRAATPVFADLELYNLTYRDDRDPKGPPQVFYNKYIAIADLVARAKRVDLTMAKSFSDWWHTMVRIATAEEIIIEGGRNYNDDTLENVPSFPITLPKLRLLHIHGHSMGTILLITHAPALQELLLSNAGPKLDDVLSFIARSPYLKKVELRTISATSQEPFHARDISVPIITSIEDILLTHDTCYILQYLQLPKLDILRMMGKLKGTTVQRDAVHFDQREIDLGLVAQSLTILQVITKLDLCVIEKLNPAVKGLEEALAEMKMLEQIRLPRALRKNGILIDKLVDHMLSGGCRHLVDIYTEDYPQWDPIKNLLIKRNRIHHLDPQVQLTRPRPIRVLHLPALPHPIILRPIQALLGGKLLRGKGWPREDCIIGKGCDDCIQSGWHCSQTRETDFRERCARHEGGMTRITAYS